MEFDTTRKAAGVEHKVFSKKDLAIPKLGEIRDKIESTKYRISQLEELRDAKDESTLSYTHRRAQLVSHIESLNNSLKTLDKDWAELPERLQESKDKLARLEKKKALAKHRKTIEAFLRLRALVNAEGIDDASA